MTFKLEAICADLGQERVALITSDGVEQSLTVEGGQEGDGEGNGAPKVTNIEVMPFSEIKN